MDNTADLQVLLGSSYPLIVATARDERRLLRIVRRAAAHRGLPVWTWSATRGLAREGLAGQYGTTDPRHALDWVAALDDPGVFVFADLAFDDPLVVRHLKELAQRARPGQTLVVTGVAPAVPPDLAGLAMPWSLRPPGPDELERLVRRTMRDLSRRGIAVALDDAGVSEFAATLRGLSLGEAERLVQRAALGDGTLRPADLPGLRAAKAELLNVDGVLELVEAEVGTLGDVGGLGGIKQWLERRRLALAGGHPGLDRPRGFLLTGVPGCGKSLVAKSLARTWELPLVRLDPARLYGKYVGESEQRLASALATVDAMAPVVLWIDEIEKGFAAGGAGDGGVSQRLLGTFLHWMQERDDGVFLVATANDVAALPPELLRKGRFDDVFFVDLPDSEARERIFAIHLARRGHEPGAFDLPALATAADGFSGAEIEAAVVGATYRVLATGDPLTTAELATELAGTVPLSTSRGEDVEALRRWAAGRALAA